MATDIDLRAIANLSSLSETTLTTLIDAPTSELVKSLLQGIEKSAKEFEQSKSQKVRLEVELETVVRTNESKVKVLQNSRDKALGDVQKLRNDLQNADTNRSQAEADLDQLKSSISTDASESSSLKSRISSLEAANRDTLALLESKTSAYDSLAQDLTAQHQKAVEQRKQITSLEQTLQATNSSIATAKFREQGLEQELNLQKKNNEWLENERKIKAEEHATFRKEKNARIAELSREREQAISEAESLRRSETALKRRNEEYSQMLEDRTQEIQTVREEKIASEANFRTQVDDANRLAELHKQNADTARERVATIEEEKQTLNEQFNDELEQIRMDSQADHDDKEAAEQKITELESNLRQLRSELEQAQQAPSTPNQPMNGFGASTPLRPSTPLGIFSPSSTSKVRGNFTMTQMVTENKRLERELANEKRTNEELQNNVDSMLQDLEANKPEIDEVRADNSRFQSELLEMSTLVERAHKERDASVKEARSYQGQLDSSSKEIQILQQQLRDLGTEIRYLLMEQHVRERGETMTPDDFKQLQEASDEAKRRETAGLSETQQVVNHQLIAFNSIADLQRQNENQLQTIRNLVSNLESQESTERAQKFTDLEQEVEVLRKANAKANDDLKTMTAHSQSFAKERDMFKTIVTRKGHLPPNVDPADFSKSLPLSRGSPAPAFDDSANGGSDYAKLLRDLQKHLDAVRQEASTNHATLRSQVDDFSKRNSELQTEASRALSQLNSATQRCEMIQANYDMLRTENSEHQKRSNTDRERLNQAEMKVQQSAEELVEARGLLDSTRRESANLKAEKELFKSVEKRLLEDNESGRNDRARLETLNNSLQGMLNERSHTDTETRRRLQSQVESLETELSSLKRKLDDEVEENRRISMRKDNDHEQSQKRIDDLMSNLGSTREELASVKTAKEHLQARVDELAVELRSAEERLEVYTKPAEPSDNNDTSEETGVSKEQELALEVSELKRDLELTKAELERANEQIEVYKNISQSSEERLQELSDTNDQYREDTDASLAQKDSEIKELTQRVQDISSELESSTTQLSKLAEDKSNFDRRVEDVKASLEGEISRLKEAEERATEQAQFNLEASKAQAQIATEAQDNYETELVKHAEATQLLHTARADANSMRLEVVGLKTKADTAESNLEEKESSWAELKDRYEHELADQKKRREELKKQNDHLHEQLQNLTTQFSSLQSDRQALTEGTVGQSAAPELTDLQEVINYLRREKEIVDIQYKQSNGEANRLRQQLQLAQSQLDDTRLKLDQQRRAEADSERNAMNHNKLMETLNELNLYRESNITLRAENKDTSQALMDKSRRVDELNSQIQPLQARVAELENELENEKGEHNLTKQDRDHWRQRTNDILSKYNRIDPVELEELKTNVANLEKERDEVVAIRDDLQAQVDNFPQQMSAAKVEQKNNLQAQFKDKVRQQNQALRDKQAEVDTAVSEKNALQSELDIVREQLASAQNQAGASAPSPGQIPEDTDGRIPELETRISELENDVASKDEELSRLRAAEVTGSSDAAVSNDKLDALRNELEEAKNAALEELRSNLESKHQQEIDALRTSSTAAPAVQSTPNGDHPSSVPIAELSNEDLLKLQVEQARFLVQHHPSMNGIMRKSIDNGIKKRIDEQLDAVRAEYEARVAKDLTAGAGVDEAVKAARQQIAQEKDAEFTVAKEALENAFADRLEKMKESLNTEHQSALNSQRLEFSENEARKIEEQVKRAEEMAAKGGALKMNMANNRVAQAQAKLGVVEKAATDTPERAVKEVWEEAKVAKPPAAPKPPVAVNTASPQSSPAKPSFPQSQPIKSEPANAQPVNNHTSSAAAPKAPNALTTSAPLTPANDIAQQPAAQSNIPNGPAGRPSLGTGPAALRAVSSGLPRGGASIRGRGGLPQPGRGAAVSGIPRGGGSSIPRGGPVGGGRGTQPRSMSMSGNQNPPGGRGGGTNSVAGSPKGNLNPSASQFVPGGKRGREEGDGQVRDDGQGKRIRGGGAGS